MITPAQLKERLRKKAGAAMFVAADIVKAEAQNLITSGSVSGRNHVPSRPGEPPNADTRQLDKSIVSRKTGPLTAEVRSEAPYSEALQFGTRKMAPRPFMDVAVERRRDDIDKLKRKVIRELTK